MRPRYIPGRNRNFPARRAVGQERTPGRYSRRALLAEKTDLAEERTDLAEDRTLLANERTFSGWARTAMAAIGIGLGFRALFKTVEPDWVPKAIATAFVLLGMFIILLAERRARAVCSRLTAHQVKQLEGINLRLMTGAVCLGAAGLIAALWVLA